MKVVFINQKITWVRHWFRWYIVQRAGEDWRRLPIGKKYLKLPGGDAIKKALKDIDKKPKV